MKRASLPLLALVLLGLALAGWLTVRARPPMIQAGAEVPAQIEAPVPEPVTESTRARGRALADGIAPGLESERAAQRALPPEARGSGHVSGWVWSASGIAHESIPDLPVELWFATGRTPPPADAHPLAQTRTGPLGSFCFAELAPGAYLVSVQREGGARHLARVALEPGEWQTVEFLLGTARVDGLVTALDGDARPLIELAPPNPRRTEQRWPDERGTFAFEDLAPGKYELRVRWHAGDPLRWREDSTRFELTDGGVASYRVGDALPLARWRGRVSVTGGAPPRADAVLRFELAPLPRDPPESEADATRRGSDEAGRRIMLDDPKLRVRTGLDARGHFDVALPRARLWAELEVDALSRRSCVLAKQTLAGGDLELDLVCPGSRVHGHVAGLGGTLGGREVSVLAERHESLVDNAQCWVRVDAHGRYVLDGVESGSWRLKVLSELKDEPRAAVELKLLSEGGVVEQDL